MQRRHTNRDYDRLSPTPLTFILLVISSVPCPIINGKFWPDLSHPGESAVELEEMTYTMFQYHHEQMKGNGYI